MEKYYIGIAIGGMSPKGALVSSLGEIKYKTTIVTKVGQGNEVFVNDLKTLIRKILNENKDKEILGIGVGLPGLINSENGIMDIAPNLQVTDLHLYDELKEFNLPVKASNDANVAALGEVKFGAAKGYSDSILLTLGTGVGGGVVINGKLFEGFNSKGAELGHMIINFDGVKCPCGLTGCLEAYASATALLRMTKEKMLEHKESMMWEYCNNDINNVNGLTSFECAKKGDKVASDLVDEYVSYIGVGILSFCNIFRPQIILIGGGISNQGDYLINKLVKYCSERDYGMKMSPKVEIKCAALKNDAGVIGAASLVM